MSTWPCASTPTTSDGAIGRGERMKISGYPWRALAIAFAAFWAALLGSRAAQAYAWMIRHEYAGCNQCHADPSGGGLLTAYGRAQSELLLRTRYGVAETDDPGRTGEFLFGLLPLPDSVLLGGDARGAYVRVAP